MKLVLISDTHGFTLPVPDGDILVHAGDLTMTGTRFQIEQAGNWLRTLPHKHKIVIAGNHDWLFQRNQKKALEALGDGFIYLENEGITVEGLKFWGSPIQPEFCNWAFNVPRGPQIKAYWDQIPERLDVLITHGPPYEVLDKPHYKDSSCGCKDLRTAVIYKEPRVHVFGHIHGGYGNVALKSPSIDIDFYNASVVNEAYQVRNAPWEIELEAQ
jgi:Icc-related predicted phosphoesterase